MQQEPHTRTMRDIVADNIKRDAEELTAYSCGYLTNAALSRDAGQDSIADAYLHAAEALEGVVMGLETTPPMVKN